MIISQQVSQSFRQMLTVTNCKNLGWFNWKFSPVMPYTADLKKKKHLNCHQHFYKKSDKATQRSDSFNSLPIEVYQ